MAVEYFVPPCIRKHGSQRACYSRNYVLM